MIWASKKSILKSYMKKLTKVRTQTMSKIIRGIEINQRLSRPDEIIDDSEYDIIRYKYIYPNNCYTSIMSETDTTIEVILYEKDESVYSQIIDINKNNFRERTMRWYSIRNPYSDMFVLFIKYLNKKFP